MWRTPALSSERQCCLLGWGRGSVRRRERREITGTANVAASRITTGCGPTRANKPAPINGATRLSVPWIVRSVPLASASSSGGSIVVSSADWPAPSTEYEKPYTTITR